MASNTPLRIGYVPEHYLLPLHLASRSNAFPFPIQPIPFPAGTGAMITALRSNEVDICIGLTEGWVAGLLTQAGREAGGYSIVGHWVMNPLRWAVVTGRKRAEIQELGDLRAHRRVGVSRLGSGSHVMAFVLAQQQGWARESEGGGLEIVPLGPFKDLRDGVTGKDGEEPRADFFMWEHFTTKPYFDGEGTPLKKVGEIYTPWPSWCVVASEGLFPREGLETNDRLRGFFEAVDQGVKEFEGNKQDAVRLLGTGELGCTYDEEDAREWLKGVEFADGVRGVDGRVMEDVVNVLKGAGVLEEGVRIQDGDGVVGI